MSSTISAQEELEAKRRRSARFHLILIGVIAASPFVGSYLLYKLWRPTSFVNHGELVANMQPPAPESADPVGKALQDLRGKWVLATIDSGNCEKACKDKLYYMRQIRLTQGKEMDRIERLWIVQDGAVPDPAMLQEFKGMHLTQAPGSKWIGQLSSVTQPQSPQSPTTPPSGYVFIIDPLGNVVLRYPPGFNPTGMKKDLSRLIRASRIG